MIEQMKILRETKTYSIHLSLIKKWDSITEQVQESGKSVKKGLLNKDLQSLVSKLDILRGFSVSTPDVMLADQISEAMLNNPENIGSEIKIHHDMIHVLNLPQCVA